MHNHSLFHLLRNSPSGMIIVAVATLGVFLLQYHLMATLPGTSQTQCVVGAGLTPTNIVFALLVAMLSGLVCGSLWVIAKKRLVQAGITISLSSIGTILAILTGFCTLCALPVLSLFGISIGFGFTSHHIMLSRLVSVVLLCAALWIVNHQARNECQRCVT